MENPCIRRLDNHKATGKTPLGFWFNLDPENNQEHLFLSPCLQTLAGALWHDCVKKLVHFINHQVSALTTTVQQPIAQILSLKNVIEEDREQLRVVHQDTVIISSQKVSWNLLKRNT
jgi:hypothetical protein